MKSTELMARDWFMFDTEHYEPYEKVREYAQVEHFNHGVVYGNSGCIAYCEDAQGYNERKYEKVMPIPLTDDILKANGFHKVHHVGTGCTQEYDDYITNGFLCRHMTDDWKDLRFCLPDTPLTFNYVHELQHALRLCGLNELADNLKVN